MLLSSRRPRQREDSTSWLSLTRSSSVANSLFKALIRTLRSLQAFRPYIASVRNLLFHFSFSSASSYFFLFSSILFSIVEILSSRVLLKPDETQPPND